MWHRSNGTALKGFGEECMYVCGDFEWKRKCINAYNICAASDCADIWGAANPSDTGRFWTLQAHLISATQRGLLSAKIDHRNKCAPDPGACSTIYYHPTISHLPRLMHFDNLLVVCARFINVLQLIFNGRCPGYHPIRSVHSLFKFATRYKYFPDTVKVTDSTENAMHQVRLLPRITVRVIVQGKSAFRNSSGKFCCRLLVIFATW